MVNLVTHNVLSVQVSLGRRSLQSGLYETQTDSRPKWMTGGDQIVDLALAYVKNGDIRTPSGI